MRRPLRRRPSDWSFTQRGDVAVSGQSVVATTGQIGGHYTRGSVTYRWVSRSSEAGVNHQEFAAP